MMKISIVYLLLSLFINTMSFSYFRDSTCLKLKFQSGSFKPTSKRLFNIKNKDTVTYPTPLLVFHLGASYIFSDGDIQFNGDNNSVGSEINFQNDLDFPSNNISPRVNIYLRFNRHLQFLFDFYTVRRRENFILKNDIQFGNTLFGQNSSVRSKFAMYTFNLAYRYSFMQKKNYDLGFLIGMSGLYYNLDIKNNLNGGFSEKASVFLPVPLIGSDIFVYLGKNVFMRGILNYNGSPFDNYKFSIFSFKTFVEYYFTKNIGLALKYHFTYTNVIDLSDEKFDGKYKFQFNAVSLAACFRVN